MRIAKRVPLRTCASCRSKRAKRDMVRIVRTPDGEVKVDITGKLSGRGVYFCPDLKCWRYGLSESRLSKLEYALRGPVSAEAREILLESFSSLPAAS
jgi:predicted RNA-binding protein YlxR (DUF448 family)